MPHEQIESSKKIAPKNQLSFCFVLFSWKQDMLPVWESILMKFRLLQFLENVTWCQLVAPIAVSLSPPYKILGLLSPLQILALFHMTEAALIHKL